MSTTHAGSPQSHRSPTLSTLPTELHLAISSLLLYPDALSLKHTCRHFYHLVDTGVRLKVEWLVERAELRLPCPSEWQCVLRSDEAFCSKIVRDMMERRRRHDECGQEGRGCVVGAPGGCRRDRRRRSWIAWGMRAKPRKPLAMKWDLVAVVAAVIVGLLGWLLTFGLRWGESGGEESAGLDFAFALLG